ncbi:histidine protein methyltransferase 1 homolog [Callorhinchus milii]|uniref:histidine protein methyltransferase 1 homolog n=1 Tax=Callorhinchus milii TaxID=7868 RepID=UPI001C3FA456|nr:histidine protein methyltransferase 1 homolog [Callorhinchus milii]
METLDTIRKCLSVPRRMQISLFFTRSQLERAPASRGAERLLERSVVERLELEALPGLRHVSSATVEMGFGERQDGDREAAPGSGSDLVSGVYEGGMKVWECTLDLLSYLAGRRVDFTGKRVLDLGCGAGLLGLLALRAGAREVHFQDYNSGVIERVTLPNALLNSGTGPWTPSGGEEEEEEAELASGDAGKEEEEGEEEARVPPEEEGVERPHKRRKAGERGSEPGTLSRCRFFSGEWRQFGREMLARLGGALRYDLILTSETVYNPQYYGALHAVLSGLLADTGTVYLATKSHYFGVGGGARLYQSFVEERKVFHARTVQVIDEGLQRCIIEMTFRRDTRSSVCLQSCAQSDIKSM